MSRHRLAALILTLAIMAGLVALFIGWSAAGTLLGWFAQGAGIGIAGVVAFWLLLAAAAAIVVTASRRFSPGRRNPSS